MSAQSLIAHMDANHGNGNSSAALMAFEEWVDENASKVFWNTSDVKRIFDYFGNDSTMSMAVDYLIDKFVEVKGTYTCAAVAAILSNTNNESVNESIVERMAPLIRDKGNKDVILNCFNNAAVRMSCEDYF